MVWVPSVDLNRETGRVGVGVGMDVGSSAGVGVGVSSGAGVDPATPLRVLKPSRRESHFRSKKRTRVTVRSRAKKLR